MRIAFYMDVHVPRAVTTALRLRGIDVLTAQEDGSAKLHDSDLLTRATQLGRILVSQNDDLLREGARRRSEQVQFGASYTPTKYSSVYFRVSSTAIT